MLGEGQRFTRSTRVFGECDVTSPVLFLLCFSEHDVIGVIARRPQGVGSKREPTGVRWHGLHGRNDARDQEI